MGPVKQALADAGLSTDEIDKVLLVGGSTRIPAVQDAVKKYTGKEPFKASTPMNVLQSVQQFRVVRWQVMRAQALSCCWM